jgi:hypothetical protein
LLSRGPTARTPEYHRTHTEVDMAGTDNKLDKAWEGKTIEEIAKAPVSALQGVSESDADHLAAAFGIKTVADLGTNKYFRWAQGFAALAD